MLIRVAKNSGRRGGGGGPGRRRGLLVGLETFVNVALMHVVALQLCLAFSVQLLPKGGTTIDDELPEIKSSTQNFDESSFQIHKRRSSKPATCTCTCETKPVERYNNNNNNNDIDDVNEESLDVPPGQTIFHGFPDEPADEPLAPSAPPATTGPKEAANSPDHSLNKLTADGDVVDSRYPWKDLSDRICYRERCATDRDCCLLYSICDRSAHVCVDCWYGSSCSTERDCCFKYPHCQRPPGPGPVPPRPMSSAEEGAVFGKCVNKLNVK